MAPASVPHDFYCKASFYHWKVYKIYSTEILWKVYFKSIRKSKTNKKDRKT